MNAVLTALMQLCDPYVAALLVPLAAWIVLSGIDDVAIDFVGLYAGVQRRASISQAASLVRTHPQKRIAIMVPCWGEHEVIAHMVQQNLGSLRYSNVEFFIGVYPNDEPTLQVARQLEARFANVHCAVCPHDGPTSKADCLNWVFQRIIQRETEHGTRFQAIVTHDAEDVIHPDSLHWINYFSDSYDMVQIPVLPLRTKLTEIVHGIYCDEFAEYQTRDMPAREWMGAFIPSNGVGTGFRRDALERLAAAERNRIFEPVCLTEDYENGYRLRLQGSKQCFVPLHKLGIATREFFPKTFRSAVRQRTRWTTGIALQTWQRHGWRGSAVDRYWLWRDRKGLIGNPLSLLTNVLSVYGVLTLLAATVGGTPWGLASTLEQHQLLFGSSTLLGFHRLVFRAQCVSVTYGWGFVAALPVRVMLGNLINSLATVAALRQFMLSRIRGSPLLWLKTEHQYPAQLSIEEGRKLIGEVLVGCGYIEPGDLEHSLAHRPDGMRIGEYLVSTGLLSEDDLYEALSLQHGVPQQKIDPAAVEAAVARALPATIARRFNAVPFKVEFGNMLVAVSEIPSCELREQLQPFTSLKVRFHLVTPTNWQELAAALL